MILRAPVVFLGTALRLVLTFQVYLQADWNVQETTEQRAIKTTRNTVEIRRIGNMLSGPEIFIWSFILRFLISNSYFQEYDLKGKTWTEISFVYEISQRMLHLAYFVVFLCICVVCPLLNLQISHKFARVHSMVVSIVRILRRNATISTRCIFLTLETFQNWSKYEGIVVDTSWFLASILSYFLISAALIR